jgi:hypothetical protein
MENPAATCAGSNVIPAGYAALTENWETPAGCIRRACGAKHRGAREIPPSRPIDGRSHARRR